MHITSEPAADVGMEDLSAARKVAAPHFKPRQLTVLQALMITGLCALAFLIAMQRQQLSSERARHADVERRLKTFTPSLPHIRVVRADINRGWKAGPAKFADSQIKVAVTGMVALPSAEMDVLGSPKTLKATLLDHEAKDIVSGTEVLSDQVYRGDRHAEFHLTFNRELQLSDGLYVNGTGISLSCCGVTVSVGIAGATH